jgi:hypothetical protein
MNQQSGEISHLLMVDIHSHRHHPCAGYVLELQAAAAAGETLAEEMHPRFERQRQSPTDQRLQLAVALRPE